MDELTKIIYENEGLIYLVINKFRYFSDKDDLYQVAVIGLMRAYENYDGNRNTKFSSYAYFDILGEVKKYVRESIGIKVSRGLQKLNLMIERGTIILAQELLRMPTDLELMKYLQINEKELELGKEAKVLVDSLDYDYDENTNLYERVGYEEVGYDSDILDLRCEIDNLNEFDQKIIRSRYYEGKTQFETSIDMGITQVQVSRHEKDILMGLRNRL